MKSPREPFSSDPDPVDEWLAQAEFPDTRLSARRLEREWRTIWRSAPSWRNRQWWIGASVAALLCVATMAGWQLIASSPTRVEHANVPQERSTTPTVQPLASAGAVHPTPSLGEKTVESRPPTPLELRMIAMLDRREKRSATISVPNPASDAAPAVANPNVTVLNVKALERVASSDLNSRSERISAMNQLLDSNDENAVAEYLAIAENPANHGIALAAAKSLTNPPTDRLLRRLSDPRVSMRMTVAAVLGAIDGPKTTAKLAEMVMKNDCRREALFALAASDGAEAKAFLERAKQTNELASAVASTLAQSTYQ